MELWISASSGIRLDDDNSLFWYFGTNHFEVISRKPFKSSCYEDIRRCASPGRPRPLLFYAVYEGQ